MTGLAHAIIAVVVVQRVGEMILARRNTARLRAEGAVEAGARHYPIIVGLHAGWLATMAVLVPLDAAIQWPWLAVYAVLQVGRVWTIASLGRFWTTRVLVVPGAVPVRRGPYRWLAHPNYLIVALEIPVLPIAFGAPGIAIAFGAANLAVLAWRIRVENAALMTRKQI
jgi:methyltransferase